MFLVARAIGTVVKLGYVPIKFAAAQGACARSTVEAWEGFRDVIYRLRERGQKTKRDFDMWEYLYARTFGFKSLDRYFMWGKNYP